VAETMYFWAQKTSIAWKKACFLQRKEDVVIVLIWVISFLVKENEKIPRLARRKSL
jgi:hypothetical protein